MAGLIIQISATDRDGRVNAHDLANYVAEIIKSTIGEDIRVNVNQMDIPSNRIDTYKTMRESIRKPWMRYGN